MWVRLLPSKSITFWLGDTRSISFWQCETECFLSMGVQLLSDHEKASGFGLWNRWSIVFWPWDCDWFMSMRLEIDCLLTMRVRLLSDYETRTWFLFDHESAVLFWPWVRGLFLTLILSFWPWYSTVIWPLELVCFLTICARMTSDLETRTQLLSVHECAIAFRPWVSSVIVIRPWERDCFQIMRLRFNYFLTIRERMRLLSYFESASVSDNETRTRLISDHVRTISF